MAETAETMRKPLYLTEEEAMALLEMCLLTRAEESADQARALYRVSDLCRDFMRPEAPPAPMHRAAPRPRLIGALRSACAAPAW